MKYEVLRALFNIEKQEREGVYIINAYNRVLKKMNCVFYDEDEVTYKDIDRLDLTDYMKDKIKGIIKSNITKKERRKIDKQILKDKLENVPGIGTKKANELVKKGLRSIDDLVSDKWLDEISCETRLLLKHRPCTRIPTKNIKKIEKRLTGIRDMEVMLVGSYRREKRFIRDLDIMIVSNLINPLILDRYLAYLSKEFSKVYVYKKGMSKMSLILKINDDVKYKADVFLTSVDEKYTMLLYSTGSYEFNIKMRSRARKMGFVLNQKGLYDVCGEKINKPNDDERAIFKMLGMKYVKPSLR
jgi:DNA polymerase/3'-5' exonuclease PolX